MLRLRSVTPFKAWTAGRIDLRFAECGAKLPHRRATARIPHRIPPALRVPAHTPCRPPGIGPPAHLVAERCSASWPLPLAAAGLGGPARTLEQVVLRAAYQSGGRARRVPSREGERPLSAGPGLLRSLLWCALPLAACVHVCMCAWTKAGGCRRVITVAVRVRACEGASI